ncbi:urease accessory protein UreE [Cyanobium sp. FGCU-52]|nr:urease accessory protein UreE [Cyanobium sp. FGCU52]
MTEPLLLTRRLPPGSAARNPLRLPLGADARTRLRGLRQSLCGRPLLLQLPRGEALAPGELLSDEQGGVRVLVEAAPEPLLLVRAADALELLRAAYHLGNRHVALEVREGELRLLEDPVLAALLEHRGLVLERRREPFQPEGGAYAAGHGHHHHHADHHSDHQGSARR